jgi:hypothetical protein
MAHADNTALKVIMLLDRISALIVEKDIIGMAQDA